MKRKTLAFLLALTLVVSIAGVSLAEFDFSVFEEYEQFMVTTHPEYHIGLVMVSSDFTQPITEKTVDKFFVKPVLSIVRQSADTAAVFFLNLIVYGGTPGTEKVIFTPDKTRYTITSEASIGLSYVTPSGNKAIGENDVGESIGFFFTTESFPMIEEIIDNEITSVKYCISGETEINGELSINIESLKVFYDCYKEAGGLEQDFSALEAMFSVEIN